MYLHAYICAAHITLTLCIQEYLSPARQKTVSKEEKVVGEEEKVLAICGQKNVVSINNALPLLYVYVCCVCACSLLYKQTLVGSLAQYT